MAGTTAGSVAVLGSLFLVYRYYAFIMLAMMALFILLRDFADRRVLLVEDDPISREIADTLLEKAGLAVDAVEAGRGGAVFRPAQTTGPG